MLRLCSVLVSWEVLATLLLLAGVHAVTFEEISSGYHTLQSRRIQSTLQFLASKHFNGRATGTPEAELTAAYIASVFQRQGLQSLTGSRMPLHSEFRTGSSRAACREPGFG